ncbi:MAG: IS21 family transposase [Candidatus Eiseniibacteriota bacterium]
MGGWRTSVLDIREMVRRFRLGDTDRRVARDLGVARNTASKYRAWARTEGFLDAADLPEPGVLESRLIPPEVAECSGPASKAEAYRELIKEKRDDGVEIRAILGLLHERGYDGSYSALVKYVRRMEGDRPREAFLRIETKPGDEAQVDFGYVGRIVDPRTGERRKAWAFVMTLSFSRHQYAEVVFDQSVPTWIALHVHAFEWFQAVPSRIVLDNLKAGIVKAALYDPEAQRAYRDLAEHYGFLIAPCRPRTPRHKGKVESGVHYVNRNALAGRDLDVVAANAHLRRWILEVAGVRDHGTTHEPPLDRFERERPALRPLPPTRFEVLVWKQAKVHSDSHVVFDYSYYSAPHRLVGKTLWVRATDRSIVLFHDHERIASHERATKRGTFRTHRDHLPPWKLEGLQPERMVVRMQAEAIGPFALKFVDALFGDKPMDRIRGAMAVVRYAKRYGNGRVDAACRRALRFGDVKAHTIRSILEKGLDIEPIRDDLDRPGPVPRTSIHARPIAEVAAAMRLAQGGARWTS